MQKRVIVKGRHVDCGGSSSKRSLAALIYPSLFSLRAGQHPLQSDNIALTLSTGSQQMSSYPPQIDPALTHSPASLSFRPDHRLDRPRNQEAPPEKSRTRLAISELERKSLRDYAHQHPKTPHKQLAAWFQSKFSHRIAQSSISDSLGSRFEYLDALSADNLIADGESKRRREPSFPQLERELLQWYQSCMDRGEQVTGELVKKAAASLWMDMSEYSGRDMPKWSNGWLEGWKQRSGITFKGHLLDRERANNKRISTEVDEQIEQEMENAKRRSATQIHNDALQSTADAIPWDMLRPEGSVLRNADNEAWDMLRPVAASLHEPANVDNDEESFPSSLPTPDPDTNRPGYDPSMPAWLRSRTWDELPWVRDGSMGSCREKSKYK